MEDEIVEFLEERISNIEETFLLDGDNPLDSPKLVGAHIAYQRVLRFVLGKED